MLRLSISNVLVGAVVMSFMFVFIVVVFVMAASSAGPSVVT